MSCHKVVAQDFIDAERGSRAGLGPFVEMAKPTPQRVKLGFMWERPVVALGGHSFLYLPDPTPTRPFASQGWAMENRTLAWQGTYWKG